MEFFKNTTNIDFMGLKKWTLVFSTVIIILSFIFISTRGLNLGLDFTGGYQIQLTSPTVLSVDKVQDELNKSGFEGAVVTSFSDQNSIMVKIISKQRCSLHQGN